jgi:hypothetical protein
MKLNQGVAPAVMYNKDGKSKRWAFTGGLFETNDEALIDELVEAGAVPAEPWDGPGADDGDDAKELFADLPFDPEDSMKDIASYMEEKEGVSISVNQLKDDMLAECVEYFAAKAEKE